MIVQKDFLNKLRDFGLNSYESKLWTALLSRGVSTAGELSDIADVPRSRSYDVLESLEKKGFIMMKIGKPIKYIAIPPSEVLERVKKQIKDDSETYIGILNSVKTAGVLDELNLLHTNGIKLVDPSDLTGSLKGRAGIYSHIESLIRNAKESIIIMTTEHGLIRQADSMNFVLEKAKKKGVKIKIAAPITKENTKAVKSLSKYAEVKNSDCKARFCVVDSKEVIFMLLDDSDIHPSYDTGIWVNTELFASTLENFFNSVWAKMKPADKVIKAS